MEAGEQAPDFELPDETGNTRSLKEFLVDGPLVHGGKPILGCDVWEHSYYLDHRNARPAYLKSFWENLINWDYVDEMFQAASK